MSERAGAMKRRSALISAMRQAFENMVYEEAEDDAYGNRRSGMRMFRGALSGLWLIEVRRELEIAGFRTWLRSDLSVEVDALNPKILWMAGLATVTYEADPGSGTTQTQWIVSIGASGLSDFFTRAIE